MYTIFYKLNNKLYLRRLQLVHVSAILYICCFHDNVYITTVICDYILHACVNLLILISRAGYNVFKLKLFKIIQICISRTTYNFYLLILNI